MMESNYDDDNLEFGNVPNFIPKDAPAPVPAQAGAEKVGDLIHQTERRGDAVIETWHRGDQLHREDGPAKTVEFADGSREEYWFCDGQLSREDGPAKTIVHADGQREEYWYQGGQLQQTTDAAADIVASGAQVEEQAGSGPGDDAQMHALLMSTAQRIAQDAKKSPTPVQSEMRSLLDPERGAAEAPEHVLASPFPGGLNQVAMQKASEGQEAARSGFHTLADGGLGLVGGLSSLVGIVGRGVGRAARGLAEDLRNSSASDQKVGAGHVSGVAPSVSVLPKISEYRVDQAEKMARTYERAMESFWQSGALPDVRRAVEEHARTTGASVPDVMAKMVPGGDLEGLRTRFVEAVNDSPEAQSSRTAMSKALDGWLRQYGRGSEELMNPNADGSPEYEQMRTRFEGTREKMGELVNQNPVFAGEELSHAERFRQAMERITQKVQEMVRSIVDFVRGGNENHERREEAGYES